MAHPSTLPPLPLPDTIKEEYIDCTSSCGLNFHTLQAGQPGQPLVLFCHGYPELAYSWRQTLPRIAAQGYFCVAPDQRGYGRTTGGSPEAAYDRVDLTQYTMTNLVRDLVCLVYKLGYKQVYAIVGHDFGAVSSSMAALIRPDIFLATVQMSHPHHPPPSPPFGSDSIKEKLDIQAALGALSPPRKHYKWYNSSSTAAHDWDHPAQGLKEFLRGYFHVKSANWAPNDPYPLSEWSAEALAVMPEYYIMQRAHTMPETIAHLMASESDPSATTAWLSDADLAVYEAEWARTGFQGALNWYRAQTASSEASRKDMLLFAGRKLEVPCCFISGSRDWGNYQQPGAMESYGKDEAVAEGCWRGSVLVAGAGHWVQQEQPEKVVQWLGDFLREVKEGKGRVDAEL